VVEKVLSQERARKEITNYIDVMQTSVLPMLHGQDTLFINKIPRLFVLIPATKKQFMENPKSLFLKQGTGQVQPLFRLCSQFQGISSSNKNPRDKRMGEKGSSSACNESTLTQ
jgi:hypothetical protein